MKQDDWNRWGRTARRLAEMIEKLGYEVLDLRPAKGYWRSSPFADCYRWEALLKKKNGLELNYGCWEPMTKCVKQGIEIDDVEKEVWCKS
jgi:hypothetical protein